MSRFVGHLVAIVVAAVLVAGCGGPDPFEPDPVEVATPPTFDRERLASFEPDPEPVADAAGPAERAGAVADHISCEHGVWQGGWSLDFGPPPPGPDPGAAVATFLTEGLFALPRSGFEAVAQSEHRLLFTYTVDGVARAAVVVADASEVALEADEGWVVETFASCDPAEFDPSVDDELAFQIWLDADGERVPVETLRSFSGPEHCDWESVTFLRFDGAGYVSDPDGALGDPQVNEAFSADTELPADAVDTGYHREGRRLWLAGDRSIAYLVDGDRVEAWPSPTEPAACD